MRGKGDAIGKVTRKSETLRMTLTSKLQVSLPARARDRYGLRAGDQLEVELGEGEMRMRPIRRRRLTELGGALRVVAPFSTHDDVRAEAADTLAEHYDARAAAASSQR